MGTFCGILFDEAEIFSSKSVVTDAFCALFQESDRRSNLHTRKAEEDEEFVLVYEAAREVVLGRLNLLGCTDQVVRCRFDKWISGKKEDYEQMFADGGDDWAEKTLSSLHKLTFDEWQRRVPGILATRYDGRAPIDDIDRHMRDTDDSWLWFDGYGALTSIRALLGACPHVTMVKLDVGALAEGQYIDLEAAVCSERRREGLSRPQPLAPTVIMAEGASDIRILEKSLSALYPEYTEYFSFFDHRELRVDGGAGYLVKFLKAFATARAPMRLVAVFDNDTTGCQALRAASALRLPPTMKVLALPDIELARAYPTIGPQGHHVVDVNGRAAGIELYLGRAALTCAGDLRPVRWTGYDAAANAYQGEVDGKGEVQGHFFREIERMGTPAQARQAFPELVTVWEAIFLAAGGIMADVQKALPPWDSWTYTYR